MALMLVFGGSFSASPIFVCTGAGLALAVYLFAAMTKGMIAERAEAAALQPDSTSGPSVFVRMARIVSSVKVEGTVMGHGVSGEAVLRDPVIVPPPADATPPKN